MDDVTNQLWQSKVPFRLMLFCGCWAFSFLSLCLIGEFLKFAFYLYVHILYKLVTVCVVVHVCVFVCLLVLVYVHTPACRR